MKNMIIGIAGGTGSGKTTLTEEIVKRFGKDVAVLCHDNYYRAHDELTYEERCRLNYDHPDSFETDLMTEHLRRLKNGEAIVHSLHISPYEKGNIFNRDPLREKKLLMHKREILRLGQYVQRDSYTLVPLSLYFSGKNVKVEVGLCRGKKLYDKRDSIAKAESDREIERRLKDRTYRN